MFNVRWFVVFGWLMMAVLSGVANGMPTQLSTLDDATHEKLKLLSQERTWRTLLHYHQQGMFSREYSEVDGEAFFLSPEGKTNPHAELQATVNAFLQQQDGDEAPHCRFPARFQFLAQRLPELKFHQATCPQFDAWYEKIKGHKLHLIFPSSYINSPSSMYGHTLLRLDGEQGHTLLSSAINFAAYTDPSDDEITYSIKGLTGGYPGYVSLVPYYEKVNEYSHIESRDIWEYELKLTPVQIDKFVRHIWELDKIRFDYFFIDENCSYRLLTLLDAVEPAWHLADQFQYRTVPSDTLRVLWEKELIANVVFRPSKTTLIEHYRAQMSEPLQMLARQLADDPYAQSESQAYLSLSAEDQAKTLELAYDYTRYLALKKKVSDPQLPKRSLKLLSLRAKVPYQGTPFAPIETPGVRDEDGHSTLRTTFTLGADHGEVGFRLNYHGWLDTVAGYREGAQIEMGQGSVRFDDESVRLERFDALHIRSVGQRHRFSHPISWQVQMGYERWITDQQGQTQLRVGGGHGYPLLGGSLYAMAVAQVAAADRFDENRRLGYGPEVGYLWQSARWNGWLSAERFASLGTQGASTFAQASLAYTVSQSQQLRLQWRHQAWRDDREQDVRISYAFYH